MKKYLEKLNAKNGVWIIPVVLVLIVIFSPTPIQRAVYTDQLSQTISSMLGLLLLSTTLIYGILIGRGLKNGQERTD